MTLLLKLILTHFAVVLDEEGVGLLNRAASVTRLGANGDMIVNALDQERILPDSKSELGRVDGVVLG